MPSDALSLDPSLFVKPEVPFSQIAAAMAALGWTAAPDEPAPEPAHAGWSWRGRRPVVHYSWDPSVGLRLLDVGSAPPAMRAAIAQALPLLHPGEVEAMLQVADTPRVLLALRAAREAERLELVAAIAALRAHGDPAVARAAAEAHEELRRKAEIRVKATILMRGLVSQTQPLLRDLAGGDPARVEALRPRPEEVARLFHPEVAQAAVTAYEALWRDPPRVRVGAEATEIDATAAPAGMFRSKNELSWAFPGGYRQIAGWLEPSRVWLCWRYRRPGATTGMSYDGLVWTGARWVWCPRPYRILEEILRGRAA